MSLAPPSFLVSEPPSRQLLGAFSSCLLVLGDVTHGATIERIVEDAMRTLQPLVRFDRAWWGQVATGGAPETRCAHAPGPGRRAGLPQARPAPPGGATGVLAGQGSRHPPHNWLQGDIGLGPSFGQEWNAFAERDEFGLASMQRLGQVIRSTEDEPPPPDDIRDFCVRWDLLHAMAITVELPGSGQLFFVSLYRGLGTPPFTDDEAGVFAEFVAHLLQGWRRRLAGIREQLAVPSWESFAVADAGGRLLYLGRRAAAELERAFPGWPGWQLPAPLLSARVPTSVTLHRVGPLLAVACARQATRRARLTPSQWNAAVLYAQGQPYTAIARQLGLSPATVRTYLRDAYALLGVRNKIELLAALQGGAQPGPAGPR